MNQHYLQLYADFIVKVGVNVQPRQNFIIRCPVTMPEFGHACVKAGYEAGAKNCIVRWEDDKLSRLHYEYAKEEDLAAMKPYELRSYLDYAEDPDGCCTLAIHAADPEALAGLDAAKINRVNLARRKFLKPWQEYTMNDRVQWCVAAVPAPSWAAKVFPGIPVEEAMEKLWALIFDVCRVSTGDPVSAWKAHVAEGRRHRDQLNAWNLDHIHMTSSNGTDLTVGLADDATWEGASSKAENGTDFIANVPTEEVFCAPHRERVNGIVYGTKPYVYNGQLIEGWHVTFKDGKVVEHGAEKNASLLAELLSTDENACRIGEIALVPASSPINQSGVLFYNTLFDENAACHIAFGAGYPTNIKGGSKMNRTELLAKGLNRMEGSYYRGRQSLGARADEAASERLLGQPQDFQKRLLEKAAKVTPEQLREVARKYLLVDKMYEVNLTYYNELAMYVLAGKQKLAETRNGELQELKNKAMASGLAEDAQAAKDLDSRCERFEKKLHDLELTKTIAMQTAPQIRLVQGNDTMMAEKIQSTLVNTIPLWKSQMVLALGVEHSAQAAAAQREVNDMTNELLRKNAEKLKIATVETAKESERGIVDIETLKATNESLIATFDEVMQIQQEGRQKRQQAEVEMQRIEAELKAKLLQVQG